MKRTAMELAALASAAMPGLDIVQATQSPDDPRAFDAATVTDTDNNHWRVRSPRDSHAAFRLETEIQVLSGFTPAIRAHLPFRVPSVAGAVQIDGLRTFVYHQMPGKPADLETITQIDMQTVDDIGRILATIHTLPSSVVEAADLPAYGAEESRSRLLSELDQMALTGKVPAPLLRRWENAFEERRMWSFIPRVVHGDFDETSLLIDRNRAVGVTAWTDLHIGDPAKDFMWLASTTSIEFREALISAYHKHMDMPADRVDLHLMRRAALAAEFSLAKYLMTGVQSSNETIIAEAQHMLAELSADIEQTGGQDIGQQFSQTAAPSGPVVTGDEPAHDIDADNTSGEEPSTLDDDAPVVTDAPMGNDDLPGVDDTSEDAAEPQENTGHSPDLPTATTQVGAGESDSVDDTPTAPSSTAKESVASEQPAEESTSGLADEHGAQLVVHTLSDEGALVPEDPEPHTVKDDDTQPISWEIVNENLKKD